MADLLDTFRQKTQDLFQAIDRKGGIRAMIEGLRRQMAEADRRRAVNRAKAELRRLDAQITEMITAVGVQAVGLHKAGVLDSAELGPLCKHIGELQDLLAAQKDELVKLEGVRGEEEIGAYGRCPACGKALIGEGSFCPFCGAPVPRHEMEQFCAFCGTKLRPQARFCAKCGQTVHGASSDN